MKGNRLGWIFLLFLAAASACGFIFYYEPEALPIDRTALQKEWLAAYPGTKLHSGDLVFRHSRGTISNMLLHFSRQDPKYSHAGILSVEKTGLFVYHSLGGEVSRGPGIFWILRSEEHTSELQSQSNLVCRLLLEKKKQ